MMTKTTSDKMIKYQDIFQRKYMIIMSVNLYAKKQAIVNQLNI